jgi:hypothetical protein
MTFHIDSKSISLDDVKVRLQEIDLVPSRQSLLKDIENRFETLKRHNVSNLAELRDKISTSKRIDAFSIVTKLESEYLNLLRREIGGWFPKPLKLQEFSWISKSELSKLIDSEYNNSKALHESVASVSDFRSISELTGCNAEVLKELVKLSRLTRIQWVNPTVARMLIFCGYETVDDVASAEPERLFEGLSRINDEHCFYKGKIGLRDIKRLVNAAAFVTKNSRNNGLHEDI